jgi:hypothetical protein
MKPLPIELKPWEMNDFGIVGFPLYQWIYRFPNGYGASVAWGATTYCDDRDGGAYDEAAEHTYELAVIRFLDGPDEVGGDYRVAYGTPITDDVLGYQSLADVAAVLVRIAALPKVIQGTLAHAELPGGPS